MPASVMPGGGMLAAKQGFLTIGYLDGLRRLAVVRQGLRAGLP
ncbi:hypothetical protein [Amycolatopsis sp. A1MSW2902]